MSDSLTPAQAAELQAELLAYKVCIMVSNIGCRKKQEQCFCMYSMV
jgi:hypothetical protein